MNERIKELAEQANDIVLLDIRGDGTLDKEVVFNKEKFAELIVDECVKVCAGVLDEYSPRAENKVGSEIQNNVDGAIVGCAMVVSNRIKKHFGVER